MSVIKSLIALSLVVPALSAFAADPGGLEKSVQLKGGSTVHHFSNGKMAMEDKFGRVYRMKEGESMETVDGKSVAMNGDEVARLFMAKQHNEGRKQ